MPDSKLRDMVTRKTLKRGTLVWEFITPGIGHLLAAAGGDFENPDHVAAVERIRAAALANGKALGRAVGTPEESAALFARGFDFICLNTDTQIYLDALKAGLQSLSRQAGEQQ